MDGLRRALYLLLALAAVTLACAFGLTADEHARISRCGMQGIMEVECVACRDGDAAACTRLAIDLESGMGPRINPQAAVLASARACELGDRLGCVRAHDRTRKRGGLEDSLALARRAREVCAAATCGGSPDDCLVRMICDCFDDECWDDTARASLERQCLAGHVESCRLAGSMLPPKRAATAMRVGCTAGDPRICLDLAAARMIGYGLPVDLGQASATFAEACSATTGVTACNAADGYLSLGWLFRVRKERGLARPDLAEPLQEALEQVNQRGWRTALVGMCLDANGKARSSKVLQSWGDPRVDEVLTETVMGWQFPGHTAADHPCWTMEFSVKFSP